VLAKSRNTDGDFVYSTLTKSSVGLSAVDNTSDLNKPVSTATLTALNLKANTASPTFTGTVTAPNLTLSEVSTATQSDVLYIAANGVVSRGAAPSGGGGTTQTINTINNSSQLFIGPSGISSGTNYGTTTLGPGIYQVQSTTWLTPTAGVVSIDVQALVGFNLNNRNYIGWLDLFARNTSTSSPKVAAMSLFVTHRHNQGSISFTVTAQWAFGPTTFSIANQGSTTLLRLSIDSDMSVTWAWRGAI
jgi:hypothetical protein